MNGDIMLGIGIGVLLAYASLAVGYFARDFLPKRK